MAKRRGPLGQLFIVLILLAVLAAGTGIALALVYEDDDMRAQLKGVGLPDDQVAQVMAVKRKIKAFADYSGEDMLFTLRAIWWDLRDAFDLDLTSTVTMNLEPVRHIVQSGSAPRPDDPKEPTAPMPQGGEPAAAPPPAESAPMPAAPEAAKPAEAMAEKPAAEAMAPAPAAPEPAPEAPKEPAAVPAKTGGKEPLPVPPKAKKAEKPAPPPATEKPVDLSAKEPEKPAETTAVAPEPEAPKAAPAPEPAPAPPATAEERLAAADLTYKRALGLFADAKSDVEKAEVAKLFAQAAIDGHPGAQYSIGVMHYNGTGVAKDYAKAAEWFGRAAEKGNPAAQYNLGILYYNGQGVEKDDRLAYKWISAAAENGDQKAIVARDALKKALPAEITKPEAPAFPSALPSDTPAAPGAPAK